MARIIATSVLLAALAGNLPVYAAVNGTSGQEIYQAKCSGCHGKQGEGTPKQKRRLEGDKSIFQLAELIGKTMPEDDPGSLASGEADAVAAYVHDTFYSTIARERNRPARVELARLTVRQYRLAVADLVGSFRPAVQWGDERGLRARYFSGRRLEGQEHAAERIDKQVNFDF